MLVTIAMEDRWNTFITEIEPSEGGPGPLSGRTLAVKDLFDTAGIRTTYGSRIYADHVPERTAVAVERLLDAGAVLVGKTHLPEFAWSVIGVNPWYGTCHNPSQPGKTTGGSSSGNAAALAAGLCELALGSDTGGSIRIPSACCGTVGLKSQWGLIPLDGAFPLCPTLDTAGPMATTVADTTLMWSVLGGAAGPEPRLAGLTVGLLRKAPWVGGEYVPEPTDVAEQWVADLERLGATVVEAEIPEPEANTWPLFEHEAADSHRETFPSRADDYGFTIRPKLERAQEVQPDDVEAAYEPSAPGAARAARRSLRRALRSRRAAARGRRRTRRALPAVGVRPLGEPRRLGGARDRQPPADRTAGRDGARGRTRLGAG